MPFHQLITPAMKSVMRDIEQLLAARRAEKRPEDLLKSDARLRSELLRQMTPARDGVIEMYTIRNL